MTVGSRAVRFAACVVLAAACVAVVGCKKIKNPIKRDPVNVFPGQPGYDKRVASFNLDPEHAYERAFEAARRDGRTEYVGRRPTVIHGRQYVFSLPVAQGANLKGYHVDGDTAVVRFYTKDQVVQIK